MRPSAYYGDTMPSNKQRAIANVRERKRTQQLNQAYKQLQAIVPREPSDKMSKIQTLKLALSYIDFLNRILNETDSTSSSGSCPPDSTSSHQYTCGSSPSDSTSSHQYTCGQGYPSPPATTPQAPITRITQGYLMMLTLN